MIRSLPLLAMVFVAVPLAGQDRPALPFLMPVEPTATEEAVAFYDNQPYVPVRRGEVLSAGFLSDGVALAFGRVLGPTRPPQVAVVAPGAEMTRGAVIAIRAPAGGTYLPGDTVVFAVQRPAPKGWGQIIVPTGLARVVSGNSRQTHVTLLTIFGPVRQGQLVYPLAPFVDPGEVAFTGVVNGARGTVIGYRDRRDLAQPGSHLFVDIGAAHGVRLGDFIQVRRAVESRRGAADTIDEPMGLGQVVHVGARSSTMRLVRVTAPDIAPGTTVVRVASLPE